MRKNTTVIIGVLTLAIIVFTYADKAQTEDKPAGQQLQKPPKPLSIFECRGNEPFWQLKIDGDAAEYARFIGAPEMKKKPLAGKLKNLDYLRPPLFVWSGRAKDASGDVVVFIDKKQCRDTMSDQEGQSIFDYTVRISMPDGEVLSGCCNAQTVADPIAQDLKSLPVADVAAMKADQWPRYLFDLMPAIRACLERTSGTSKWVTKAWPMNKGMVGVRTGTPHGGKWECIAAQESGDIDVFKALSPDVQRLPGEGITIFTPINQKPPKGECFNHERVLNPDGEQVGWLSFDNC